MHPDALLAKAMQETACPKDRQDGSLLSPCPRHSQGFTKAHIVQVNLDMTDSMGPGKLVRHMQNPSYAYDKYLICIRLGPSISSVICKNLLYSGPSYPSSPVIGLSLHVHSFIHLRKYEFENKLVYVALH